jgi:ParB/RepB/Spo0J family partition protein
MDLEFHQLEMRYEGLRVRQPERQRRLLSSLAEGGQQVAIVVIRLTEEPNRFLVIDGHQRIRALQRLGQDTVWATVWDLEESEALILDRSLRMEQAETALEQGWLLGELHGRMGLTLEDLARRFDRSISWVSRRLAMVHELPGSVQEYVREGAVGAHAAMKYLVPMARAKRNDCQRLAEKIAHHRFCDRDIGLLYDAWRQRPLVRERLLENPKLFLRAQREMEQEDPRGMKAGEELFQNLEKVGAMARQMARKWQEAVGTMEQTERESAWWCLQQAIADLTQLSEKMGKENGYVEPESEDRHSGVVPPGGGPTSDCPSAAPLSRLGQESDWVAIESAPHSLSCREGRSISSADPGTICRLPREPGASP